MNRLTVIQEIIDVTNASYYLEIGVQKGYVFLNVNILMKYGIDPKFLFNLKNKINDKQSFTDACLYEITSNNFFEKYANVDLVDGIDVAFIDGLHTYEQSLFDVKNCLQYLNPGGIIIIHDCNPLSKATAYPVKKSMDEVLERASKGELPGWNGCWNGDVWKTLIHLRIENNDLEIFTLDLDWGLGIIRKGVRNNLVGFDLEQLKAADYSFLDRDRENLLNLKPPKYLQKFLNEIYRL